MSQSTERWSAGDLYEPYVGRWSRLVARDFLSGLALPPGLDWLDVGCGTGALTSSIAELAAPASVTGVDPSAAFIAHASARLPSHRVNFETADAQALPFADARFGAAVSGLVLNFVPQPARALAEMCRVVKPGALVAAYVWDYSGRMDLMRHFWDAAAALDPAAIELDEGRRFPLCQPGPLAELFSAGGLLGVDVRAIDVPTTFRDFDDFWSPFLGGQGPAPGYAMSLDESRRGRLREQLRARLPAMPDSSIPLLARAWSVRGSTPR
jgi:SAM-dependent methyltransferase